MRVTGREEVAPEARKAEGRRSFEEVLEHAVPHAPPSPAFPPSAPSLPELREAAQAIPTAIWAGRAAGGHAVELAFGRGLSIELREVAGGIELALRAAPELARAAHVDLPALIRVLRDRGVTVVRAEVRPRPRDGRGGDRSAGR